MDFLNETLLTLVDERQAQNPVTVDRQFDGLTPPGMKDWSVWTRHDAREDGDVNRGLGRDHVNPHQLCHQWS